MNNTMYFLRKKSFNDIEHDLMEKLNLKLCFKNKKERIFKNNELLITCKDKYISVLIYDDSHKSIVCSIANQIF